MNRIVKSAREIVELSEAMIEAKTYFVAGNNSLWVPSTQSKIMDASVVKQWPTLDGELVPMTPGEAARTELMREFPGHKRVGWSKGHIKQFDWRPPLYCNPAGPGKYVCIDLTSAYHQIYQYLWLNTPFPLGRGTMPLFNVGQRLERWKSARNALVGICRSRHGTAYKNGRRIEISTRNAWLSPGLWATIQAVLNEIACKAVTVGAVYVNTDGYIFPVESPGWDLFENWLEKNGFNWSVRAQGRGEIAGWSCYKVGQKETHLYSIGSRPYGKVNSVKFTTEYRFTAYLEKCRQLHQRGTGATIAQHQSADNPQSEERSSIGVHGAPDEPTQRPLFKFD